MIAGRDQERGAQPFEPGGDAGGRPRSGRQHIAVQRLRKLRDLRVIGGNRDPLDPGLAQRRDHSAEHGFTRQRQQGLVRNTLGIGNRIGRAGTRARKHERSGHHLPVPPDLRLRQTCQSTPGAASTGWRSRHGVNATGTPVWRSIFQAA